jgi:hypothetical protein
MQTDGVVVSHVLRDEIQRTITSDLLRKIQNTSSRQVATPTSSTISNTHTSFEALAIKFGSALYGVPTSFECQLSELFLVTKVFQQTHQASTEQRRLTISKLAKLTNSLGKPNDIMACSYMFRLCVLSAIWYTSPHNHTDSQIASDSSPHNTPCSRSLSPAATQSEGGDETPSSSSSGTSSVAPGVSEECHFLAADCLSKALCKFENVFSGVF